MNKKREDTNKIKRRKEAKFKNKKLSRLKFYLWAFKNK